MGVWRSAFRGDVLFRWDIFSVIVLGVPLAVGGIALATDWFPHNLLIAQICFGFAAFSVFIKIVRHAAQTEGNWLSRALFATMWSVVVFLISILSELTLQEHKTPFPITRLIPVTINWSTPASINVGTPLSSRELNATASVKGEFVYNPTYGDTLSTGTNTLSVTFLPSEPDKYQQQTKTVPLKVLPVRDHASPSYSLKGQTLKATDITVRACSAILGQGAVIAAQRFVGNSECAVVISNNSRIMLKNAVLTIHISPKKLKITTIPNSTLIPSKYGSMSMVGETYRLRIPVTLVKGGATFPLSIQLPPFHTRILVQLEIIQNDGISLGVWGVELIPLGESE